MYCGTVPSINGSVAPLVSPQACVVIIFVHAIFLPRK